MPSTNPCGHVRSRLGQYSSGEDDSGGEELAVPQQDLKCSDDKRTIYVPQATLFKQSRQTNIEGNNLQVVGSQMNINRKYCAKAPATNIHNHSGAVFRKMPPCQHHCGKPRIWKKQAFLNSVEQCESTESDGFQKECPLHARSEPNTFDSAHNTGKISPIPEDQSVRSRRVLSDITRETVSGLCFQKPSYYSRDVLPLEANNNAHKKVFISKVNETGCAEKNWKQGYISPNGIHTISRKSSSHGSLDISNEFKTMEEKGWFSLHYQKVSMILVTFVLLFFLGLGIIYLNVRFKDASKNIPGGQGDFYPICAEDNIHPSCIDKSKLPSTLNVLQILTSKLRSLAVDFYCNSSTEKSIFMSESEVREYMIQNIQEETKDAETHIWNLKLLILSNPHWKVKVFSGQPGRDGGTKTEASAKDISNGVFSFEEPMLPYSCQFNLLFHDLYNLGSISLPLLLAIIVAVFGLLLGIRHYNRLCERHRQNVYLLVNKIIATLKNHHRQMQFAGKNVRCYVTVAKCKSDIIHPNSCKSLTNAWADAEKFIDKHESRILSDVLRIQERMVKVWQWQSTTSSADGTSSNTASNRSQRNSTPEEADVSIQFNPAAHSSPVCSSKIRRKVWQGQAFETNAGSPNSLQFSPTPCLKIRHMFDPELENGDKWPILIEDSILEKCENVKIIHCSVDQTSPEGCVFIKCASAEEAGKAYRALHGWWFDTKLVTVKYLRVERYYERFPGAVWAKRILRPSNNERLSLQELWQSPSDST